MKVGDLVKYCTDPRPERWNTSHNMIGTVIDFPPATHSKEFQKVRVITEEGVQDWVMQFCEVVSESR